MTNSDLMVETNEKQILLSPPASEGHSVLSNKPEQAVNMVELLEEKSSGKCGLDVYRTSDGGY